MTAIDLATVGMSIRDDLAATRDRAWQRLGHAGTWWSGDERVAIAAEVRAVSDCELCGRRKAALSPYSIDGTHTHLGRLTAIHVDMIHRIVSDPGRLTRQWYEGIVGGRDGLSEGQYAETVGVIATVVMIDTFARGVGFALPGLPEPLSGEPSHYRPNGADERGAWLPLISFADHQPAESDLFAGKPIANIRASLSIVPDEARAFNDLVNHHYMPRPIPDDFFQTQRSITRAQTELLAARVSALNGCFY
ncbi:MAG: alkylhydroperoxidase-related (seleno)protein [Proteobacteria bacterium]|nr:alkylhydroperoxidase-related (seleno)protein [Pseudomonadota bacterium]